jgi:hypothetical protein
MRVVRETIVVEYDSVEEKKKGNVERNSEKFKVVGGHHADGKIYVYYERKQRHKDRVESFPVVFTKPGYANFKQGKVYEARARYVYADGTPSYYQIIDEDGDSYHIGDHPLKLERGWQLHVEEDSE